MTTPHQPPSPPATLSREVGIFGATMMGLGSILGTGIFVSMAVAAGIAGPSVLLAILVAAVVACCNALSSAQLAANHPVSGGTYEYGYRWLNAPLGFTAGWMFLCAKSASAATAALGLAGYTLQLAGTDAPGWLVPLAVAAVAVLTLLVLTGIRRTAWANTAIVSVTIFALLAFVAAGLPAAVDQGARNLQPFFAPATGHNPVAGFLSGCALMFVAYTGYGRIATLGEEIRDPRRNIPLAILSTLVVSLVLYLAVAGVSVALVGSQSLLEATTRQAAPLQYVASRLGSRTVELLVSLGAITAMLGVLLNLILGLSRVVLAMGRRGDLPAWSARLSRRTSSPNVAVVGVGCLVAALATLGDVQLTWSFSAFTVLIYYALTNLAAIRLSPAERLYPAWIAWCGLAACLLLAFWVEFEVWLTGLGVIAAGLAWQQVIQRRRRGQG